MARLTKVKSLQKKPRKRDRAGTERAIMMAAGELFAKKGYENTRTLEIAKTAGANEALITRYFGGKEGLLMAILSDGDAFQAMLTNNKGDDCKFHETFATPAEISVLTDAVSDFFKQGAKLAADRQQFMRISCSRAMVDPKMAAVVRSFIIDRRLPMLMGALGKFLDPNKVSKEELEAAVLLMSTTNFMFNFMGRHIYNFGDDRINRASKLLATMLGEYFKGRTASFVQRRR